MSVADEKLNKRGKGKGAAGGRMESLRSSRTKGNGINGNDIDPDAVRNAVVAVIGAGAALMFGLTSDGGALVITVLDGDDRYKEYLHEGEEINFYLAELAATYGQ